MKALIFSDTHGRINRVIDIINSHENVDLIIHLGDLVRDAYDIESVFKNIRIEYVSGNNDFSSLEPSEKIIEFAGKKLFMTHGHEYKTYLGYDKLVKRANGINVDAALFGHTHVAYSEVIDGLLVFNPGSIYRPRKGGPSYGMLEVINDKLNYMICELSASGPSL